VYLIETMFVCRTVPETFSVKERRDLDTGVGTRGRSTSLKTGLFDRPYHWSAIVSKAVCCTIFKYLMLNNRDHEKVTQGHSNWYHSKAWARFPPSPPIVTMVVSFIVYAIFNVKE